jgi:phosphatidylinositol dimannoside acyltransferase
VRAYLVYGLYRLAGGLVNRLSMRSAYRLAAWTGWLLYLLSRRLRRALICNMRHVLGPDTVGAGKGQQQVRGHARRICVNLLTGYCDLFRVDRLTAGEIKKLVQVEGWQHLEQAVAKGQGVVIISPHFGSAELAMHIPAVYGLPATIVVEHIRPERLYRYIARQRASHGLRVMPADGPMLGLFRALKRGEVAILICDRDLTGNVRDTIFFDAPARLPDGPVQVAWRTGAALLPAFALRLPGDRSRVTFEAPLDLPHTGNREADVQAGVELVVAVLQRWIGRHPDQWLVSVPAWSTGCSPR